MSNYQSDKLENTNYNDRTNINPIIKLLKSSKINASCYVAFFIATFLLVILGYIFVVFAGARKGNPMDDDYLNYEYVLPPSFIYAGITFFAFGIVFGIGFIICGILATVYSAFLTKKFSVKFKEILILSAIGIIIIFLGFVACCMTIYKSKKLLNTSVDDLNLIMIENKKTKNNQDKLLTRAIENSKCYIAFVVTSFVLFLLAVILTSVSASQNESYNNWVLFDDKEQEKWKKSIEALSTAATVFSAFGGIFSLITLISGILTLVFSISLKSKYGKQFDQIFIFSLIGVIVPFLTFVACCMTFPKCKKMLSSPTNNNENLNKNDSNPS